jgi:hypothetical protein
VVWKFLFLCYVKSATHKTHFAMVTRSRSKVKVNLNFLLYKNPTASSKSCSSWNVCNCDYRTLRIFKISSVSIFSQSGINYSETIARCKANEIDAETSNFHNLVHFTQKFGCDARFNLIHHNNIWKAKILSKTYNLVVLDSIHQKLLLLSLPPLAPQPQGVFTWNFKHISVWWKGWKWYHSFAH